MTLQIVKHRGTEMWRTYDVWAAINYVMEQVGGKDPVERGWTIDKPQGDEKRMLEQPQFVNILCGVAAMAMIAPTPALAAGRNGGAVDGGASVSVASSVTCDDDGCITNDNEVIEPIEISAENGAVYVY